MGTDLFPHVHLLAFSAWISKVVLIPSFSISMVTGLLMMDTETLV